MKNALILSTLLMTTACASTSTKPASEINSAKGFDSVLSTYQYPFPVHYYNFKSQGQDLKMAYMDVAPTKESNKGTIVLLHGKNFPGAYFETLINSLTAEGFRVIVPDQIGFGKSTKPAYYQYSFHALGQNTQNLLKSLNVEKYKLLGHSMGGMVASRMSLMFPDSITQLFLVNPIGLEDWKTMTSYRPVEDGFRGELASSAEKIKQYQLDSYYDGKWKPEYDKWLEIPTGWILGPDYPVIAWNAALTSDMVFTQPVIYEFKNIKAPTVLIIGQRDRTAIGKAWAPEENKKKMGNYPVLGRQAARLIPKSKLEELKGLGHMPFIEDYNAFWSAMKKHL
ncbi:alpha/beta hydrolase [Bdellovibrio bacteriovorus]|uniref:Probable hydrolytic enzyme n=1 Tax=Bdellovibrio bacteriovorus (strain ATCC 15356 / DSM 50701 / NCIMB 9529 / HD100) TaxID=264462 RepID=Q6MPI1_BDEBA|nr:alpha/beta hydrolase [Bdellovibrio bacteriovorus]CAE78817.1 probable hydrolytic enzyme [Bdellovibrio bacteriovorus HD100]